MAMRLKYLFDTVQTCINVHDHVGDGVCNGDCDGGGVMDTAKAFFANAMNKEALDVLVAISLSDTFEDLFYLNEAVALSMQGIEDCTCYFTKQIDRSM